MYYFLNGFLGPLASGVEHAELKRIKLFNQFKVPAKIVTLDYSPTTRSNNAFWNLAEDNFVNLYDFYAGTETCETKQLALTDLAVAHQDYRIEHYPAGARFWEGQRKIADVSYFPGREPLIRSVDYFDGDAQKIRTDIYDERGFRAYSKYWATTDNVADAWLMLEQFYTIEGKPYLNLTYRRRGNGVALTNYRLLTLKGELKSFMNRNQLATQFYDDLNQRNGGHNTFISDRTSDVNFPMGLMQTPARKIECLHSIHFTPYWDPFNSELCYDSLRYTDQLNRMDMIITSTPQQANDLRQRLRSKIPIVNVPVGTVSDEQLATAPVPVASRTKGKVVIVSRLFSEKNIGEAISAFKTAHDQLPWLTCDIYGYADDINGNVEERHLHQLVNDLELQDVVQFKGYTNQLDEIYNQAELMLLSSKMEGFALVLLEANAHGVPVVSYDTYYGPAYIIKNGQSGYVVPYGDREAMADKIVATMSDQERLQQLSTGAYQRAKDFSAENVWELWQKQVVESDPALDLSEIE